MTMSIQKCSSDGNSKETRNRGVHRGPRATPTQEERSPPVPLPVRQKSIPKALRQLRQWIVWQWEKRNGKWTKVPYNPRTGFRAKTDDPATWATFEEAWTTYQSSSGQYAGVGFVFSGEDGLCGIDLDDCRDPKTGKLAKWALRILKKLSTYAEVSPSGTGVKLFALGRLPTQVTGTRRGYQSGAVEMYHRGRYFAVTGGRLKGVPAEPVDCTDGLGWLWKEIGAETKNGKATSGAGQNDRWQQLLASLGAKQVSDEQILNRAKAASNGADLERLWMGEWSERYASQSEADLALCGHLAFWAGPDPERIDQLFRRSRLFRDKWDEGHFADGRTYGQGTIEKALEERAETDFFHWRRPCREAVASLDAGRQVIAELVTAAVDDPGQAIQNLLEDEAKVAAIAVVARGSRREYEAAQLQLRRCGAKAKEVDALVRSVKAIKSPEMGPPPSDGAAEVYEASSSGIIWLRPTKDGPLPTKLTNFLARVATDVVLDDGVETQRAFEVDVQLNDRRSVVTVPADEYEDMGWVTEKLGPTAILAAGRGLRDHARAAIQFLSGKVPKRRLFAHTGWRKIGGRWLYLHAGGAIGAVAGVGVQLHGNLSRYRLPPPPTGEALQKSIRASLDLLKVITPRIAVPLLAATFRAPLGPADFSVYLVGPTGAGKSELAALCQQHFGAEFHARNLSSWARRMLWKPWRFTRRMPCSS